MSAAPPGHTTTLVRGRYVVTGVQEGRASVIEDGALLQRDGVIVEVGPAAELARRHPGAPTLGSPDTSSCPASSTAIITSG